MKIIIDTHKNTLMMDNNQEIEILDLYSKQAFEVISRQWVRVGWNQKYQYTFSWMGRPVIQLPEDLLRIQEVIYQIKPDVIVETGIAHGGSLIFYASICKAMGKGRVIGIDIDIRNHNRIAIESHPLKELITLIEGGSTSPEVVSLVNMLITPGDSVLVILDSNHSYKHVLHELETYSDFVTPGSFIIATDGIMEDLADVERGNPAWCSDNPQTAVKEFLEKNHNFELKKPSWFFNESELTENITHWPNAWLRRC